MIEPLDWDTDFFGFPIGRVEGSCGAMELKDHRCVYWLTESGDDSPGRLGFRKVDERLTLLTSPSAGEVDSRSESGGGAIRKMDKNDLIVFRDTVRSAHTDSRFFVDLRFPRDRSELLYERWLERDLAASPETCWTAERNGHPAGYLTLTTQSDRTSIGLLGVIEAHRGRGIANGLIREALKYSAERALPSSVITQGRNEAALKTYRSAGFEIDHRQSWWHWWADESAV